MPIYIRYKLIVGMGHENHLVIYFAFFGFHSTSEICSRVNTSINFIYDYGRATNSHLNDEYVAKLLEHRFDLCHTRTGRDYTNIWRVLG